MKLITGAQIRAARALLRWSAEDLAKKAKLGVATVRRADTADREGAENDAVPTLTAANLEAIQRALEAGGIQFVPENGGGAGVRFRKRLEERKAEHEKAKATPNKEAEQP